MKTDIGKGYSLWLVSDRNAQPYIALEQLIWKVAEVYQTPTFIPHVTLMNDVEIGEQEMRRKSQTLAKQLAPLPIQFGELGSNGIYFQQLFSIVTPTEPLVRAREITEKTFGLARPPYFPHSSFAYGDLTPGEVAYLQELVLKKQPEIVSLNFEVTSIEVWSTNGPIEEWYFVATFPLQGPRE